MLETLLQKITRAHSLDRWLSYLPLHAIVKIMFTIFLLQEKNGLNVLKSSMYLLARVTVYFIVFDNLNSYCSE